MKINHLGHTSTNWHFGGPPSICFILRVIPADILITFLLSKKQKKKNNKQVVCHIPVDRKERCFPFFPVPFSTLHVSVVVGHSQARLVRRVKKVYQNLSSVLSSHWVFKDWISCTCQHALFTLRIFLSLLSLSILTDTPTSYFLFIHTCNAIGCRWSLLLGMRSFGIIGR